MAIQCPQGSERLLVTCGKPTRPPHTDEKNPGTCSRTKVFCVSPGASAPDWACWQHDQQYQTETTSLTFQNCADAAEKLSQGLSSNQYAGGTIPVLTYAASFQYRRNNNGQWTCEATLRWSVNTAETVVRLPDITWPNMTAAEKAAVQRALNALRAHEEGHIRVAETYASELSANGGEKLSASGDSKQLAKEAVQQWLKTHEQNVTAELDRRGNAYDELTQHGLQQSNIGGQDVLLICP